MKKEETAKWHQKYLARCTQWKWQDATHINTIALEGEITNRLDYWQTLVFHEAQGSRTIIDIINWFPSQYQNKENVPSNYKELILEAGRILAFDLNLIELRDIKENIQVDFELPKEN